MILPNVVRNISVNVTDDDGGVSGASVVIDGVTRTTGSAGGCTFADVSDGLHIVTITADGYEDYRDSITVGAGNVSFVFTLTKS